MNGGLISRASALAGERLAGMSRRWSHVRGVAQVAAAVSPRVEPANSEAIIAAAWLHDVGYAPGVALTGFHPVDGARFARDAGMPELVVALIAYHTGADAEAVERGLSSELAEFPRPSRESLDVVTFADMTTSPDGDPITAEDRVAEILARYADDDPVHAAVSRSASELLASVARVYDRLDLAPASSPQPR